MSLLILTQNVKFGYSQVTQRRYSRREFPREFGRTNTQKSEWVHFFYRKFPYFSQREFPKVSAVMGTQKHWMYVVYKTFLLWESEVGKISPFFETFFWEMTSPKNFECLLHHGDAFGRIFIFSVTFSKSFRK